MRRWLAILTVAIGVGLIAIPIVYSMFSRTEDAERILDRFTFLTLGDNPARYLDEAETTRAGSAELISEAIPGLATDAGLTETDLERLTQTLFPALLTAQEEIPLANDFSIRYSEQLDAVDEKFQSVYDIPVGNLPLPATPWLFLLAGLAVVAAGSVALRAPPTGRAGRASITAILVLGISIVIGPLAFSAIAKSSDGEDVKDFASRGLTAMAATAAQEASAALDRLVEETDEVILPELARRQGIPAAEAEAQLASEHPAAARFLSEWNEIGPRLIRLADAVTASVAEFEAAGKLPISLPVWLLLGAGSILSLAAGIALARTDPGSR